MLRHQALCGTLCLFVVLSGCSGSETPESSDNQNTVQQVGTSGTGADETQRILDSIYGNRRTPEGFYTEPQPVPGVFQSIAHIRNVDIMAPGDYTDETPRFELCADTFSDALDWSLASSNGLGDLVDNSDHTLFYQFSYVPPATPQLNNLQRVYKCGVVDRSALDIRISNGHLGRYTETEHNPDHIKLLIEYLWTFSEYNNYGNAILSSVISDTGDAYRHDMEHARLVSAVDPDSECDTINVYRVSYRIDKSNGEITNTETLLNTIHSRYQNGNMEVCEE